MADRIKMDTSVNAVSVNSTFGVSRAGGTPGKAPGNNTPDSFVAESIDSADETKPWPDLPPYWNSHGPNSMPE